MTVLLLIALQLQIGAIGGTVSDPSHGAIRRARVVLREHDSALERTATTDEAGAFLFHNLSYGLYQLKVEASGFRAHSEAIRVRSNLTVEVAVVLALAGTEEAITVRAEDEVEASPVTRLGEDFLSRFPGLGPGGGVQPLVATAPGWATEDNGLLHSRGVDDGFLFVVGGIPWSDRVDRFFASAMDVEAFHSLEILDGHLPVEYGYSSGGVINVVPRSGLSRSWAGTTGVRLASEESADASFTVGGALAESAGLFLAGSYGGSGERYLDPVDPDNFNNSGSALRITSRLDWRPTAKDLFIFDASGNGSGFRVTNTLEQELAGQRQRRELRDDHQSVVWQRMWAPSTGTDLAWYRHSFGARLFASEGDTPISADQDRGHVRQGVLLNMTHQSGEHILKAGADFQRVSVRERFSFFVTEEGEGISSEAEEHGPEDPFRFSDTVTRHQGSAYFQDTLSPVEGLTINAGVRFDWTTLLVRDTLLSPRIGVAYFIRGLGTTVRGSYDRLFKPPQVENLLLSSSEEARELSPFEAGGADVFPERQHAFEAGFSRVLGGWALFDAAYWRRDVRNYADPNVFFGTTIIFPNSVFSGVASGVNVRIELPFRRGVSGFLSYGNSLVRQTGPINGGLFLEDEIIDIGPGTTFTPDHDQRNVGAFGFTYRHRENGLWASLYGRYESGTPLEVDEEELDEVMERRGAELVDFDRMRVKPRTLLDVSAGIRLFAERRVSVDLQLDVRNLAGAAFAYNFSNPFSGTHFGHPRLISGRLKLSFQ